MRSSRDGEKMKTSIKLFAVMAVLALAVVPLLAVDDTDAAVKRQDQWQYSGFTDNDAGKIYVTLANDSTTEYKVKLVAYETGNHDHIYAQTALLTVPGTGTDDGKLYVELSWKFDSSGTKYVDVLAYDENDAPIGDALLNENSIAIEVTHSIWKNAVTYIVIVVIVIIVIVIVVMYIRSTKKTKADTTMSDRTFTKMHHEKMGRKSAAAQKTEYKSSGTKTRKK